jgi:methylphosphotriester-DNA--protein-cysteine methyltransferase
MTKVWKLVGADGEKYQSTAPGALGGHSGTRIYGRLDCSAALRAIARGGYLPQRVFFLNEAHAQGAGYRPCGACLPGRYARWKRRKNDQAHACEGTSADT